MEESINKLKRILIKDTPILFLGAGFSYGAKVKNEKNIPLGDELKKILLKEFLKLDEEDSEYKELNKYSLSQVSQYCSNLGLKIELIDFLTNYFSNIKPANYHYLLTNYYWRKIYTTNIDDIVEEVYKKNDKDLIVQQYKRKNTYKNDKATEYFKLHGSVNNPSEGYVFSTEEYIGSMLLANDYRFSSLATDMNSEHIIFIGSNFDEINLDYYLKLYENTGYASSKGRLFFINPNPSIILRSKIKKVQGHLIEWTNKEFLEFITKLKEETKIKIDKYDLNKDLNKLGFININKYKEEALKLISYNSDLYLGYEPNWNDIYFDWDFINNSIINNFNEFINNDNENVFIYSLYGKAYIGKSTFLKRIAVNINNLDFQTYGFEGKHFNYYPFLQFIIKSDYNEFALIMDNAAYNYLPLKYLAKAIPKNKKLIIITASRPFFHFRWRYNFVGLNWKELYIEPKISKDYAKNIYYKLEEKGYIGDLKKIENVNDRISKIVKSNDVMSTLFSLTYGKGFVKRLYKDLNPILKKDNDAKDLLVYIAIFNKVELADFPTVLIGRLFNIPSNKLINKIDSFIKNTAKGYIQLRSGFFTKRILSSVNKKTIINSIKTLLIAISSQVNDKEHTYWNEIHAAISKEKSLRKLFQLNNNEIKNLLYEIRNYYLDNFNYWIQLGISEQRNREFEKALNHFRQAEALRPNSYMVQNAIGRNFLKQANSINNYSIAKKYFEEGESILLDLINNREEFQARAYSTHCYLYEKIMFIQKFNVQVNKNELLKMYDYLKVILDKDPEDIMAKHINNVFFRFLKRINMTNIIKIRYEDISILRDIFKEYDIDINDLLDDIEIQ